MSDTIIKIKGIKGIKEFSYTLPAISGVYLLTGANGTGKTTLLSALNRMGNSFAFSNYFNNDQISSDHSIVYKIGSETVNYQRKKKRWTPIPRTQSKLIEKYKYHQSYYLTATGLRLYQQSTFKLSKTKYAVSDEMVIAMNYIFNTDRFSNLQYIKVKAIKGRQTMLHRNNKLYVLKNSLGRLYSELSFSLGERMVLNALDYISEIHNSSMLLIDEIELALHPLAQVRFYDYLSKKATEKDLVIIISTHSATLIKRAENLQYLENNNGIITMIDNIKSAYVLKDLSVDTDNNPDYLFFVEDVMAKEYVTKLIDDLRDKEERLKGVCIKVIPVGPYEQVLTLMNYFYGVPPFSKNKVHSFVDEDVKGKFETLQRKADRSESENRLYNLFNDNRNNYNFLSITPELGFWNEITNDKESFVDAFTNKYTDILFDLKNFIDTTDNEEKAENPRSRAKGCLKNLYGKILNEKPDFDRKEFDRFIIDTYVKRKMETPEFLNDVKSKIMPILSRR